MLPEQCRMARSALSWSAAELAQRAGIATNTVRRFESGENAGSNTIERLRAVFENNGIRFLGSANGQPGVELKQQIWRLSPKDPNHANWEASTYKAPVLVRAPSERIARWRAKIAFSIATQRKPGCDIPICPWCFEDFVSAERLNADAGVIDGPTEILEPKHGELEVPPDWDKFAQQ